MERPGNRVEAHSVHAVFQIQNMYGNIQAGRREPLPRALPPGALHFTDRTDEFATLDRYRAIALEAGEPLVVVITGPPGMGKTELAVKWLRRISGEIPGAHLWAELVGAVSPRQYLGRFLRSLGMAAPDVPRDLDEMADSFRTLTSEQPVIVLLDNVVLASQIRVVRPNAPGSVLIATARDLDGDLSGAEFIGLDPLPDRAAFELLSQVAGDGRREEADAVVALCKGRPVSLKAAGRQLASRSVGTAIRAEYERLGDGAIVTSVFNVGYRWLGAAAAAVYRALGALFGRWFTAEMATAAADVPDASDSLAELVSAGLVEDLGGGAYRMHDLALEHARSKASPDEYESALRRLLTWYLRRSVAADRSVMPGRWWLGPEYERYTEPPLDRDAAWEWLQDERGALLSAVRAAAERGWHRLVVQLVEAQWSLCFLGKYHDHWTAAFELGRDSAVELGDLRFEGRMRCQLGFAYAELGRHAQAAAEFTAARRADHAAGHVRGEATAVESLGLLQLRRCGAERLPALTTADAELAAEALALLTQNLTQNLALAADAGDDRAVALAWRHRGRALSAVGDHEPAIRHLRRAHELIAAVGDTYNEGRALTDLGQAYLRAGRTAEARPELTRALDLLREGPNRAEEAVALRTLGEVADREGDREAGSEWLRRALAALGAQHAAVAEEIRRQLNDRS